MNRCLRVAVSIAGLLLSASASAGAAGARHPGELFLAGGALATCSDLAPRSCREATAHADARQPARYGFDADGVQRALDPLLWQGAGAPARDDLQALLDHALRHAGGRAFDARQASDLLDGVCVRRTRAGAVGRPCRDPREPRPWRRLLDDERSALLAAFELPQVVDGRRARERADPAQSREPGGNRVLQAFVAAARERAGGATPKIAVVTASAWDPFDPVDVYLSAFRALGAEPLWWPVDAALNRALFADGDCRALDARRRDTLGLPARARIYPDLAAGQQQACESARHLALLPLAVHGMFFAGGDQWRLRRAFFDSADQPNDWLRALRQAHAGGMLVVGGTSAGAAVQSGAAMLSNGTPAEALRTGAIAAAPPAPGCGRAGRCPDGLVEDSVTYWPAGGLGLAAGLVVDTHFSERARELRLLRLLADSGARYGVGVDETSALQVRWHGGAPDVPAQPPPGFELRALGAAGGWLFEARGCRGGALQARVHYLAPGAALRMDAEGTALLQRDPGTATEFTQAHTPVDAALPHDALADGALRAAAQALARGGDEVVLRAGNDGPRVRLAADADTQRWHGADAAYAGIGPLTLEVVSVAACTPAPPSD